MRVDSFVLLTSFALVASASDASGDPIPSHKSVIVQLVAESQQSIPVKRLLRANETFSDEERAPTPSMANLFRSKAPKIWSELPDDEVLELFLTKRGGTSPTALDVVQHKDFKMLVKFFEEKPDVSLMAKLSGRLGDKNLAMALHQLKKSGRLSDEDTVELMNEHFSYLELKDPRNAPGSVFKILIKADDPQNPISMFNGEIDVLENYLRWRYRKIPEPDRELYVASGLIHTLAESAGPTNFVSLISTHHLNPEAQLLEKKLYEFLPMEYGGRKAVKGLFWFGKLGKMDVKLLSNQEVLNMLGRFYHDSPGSQSVYDVKTTVKALKEVFWEYRLPLLITKALKDENKAIKNVAKELEIEYFKQEKHPPDELELLPLDDIPKDDRESMRKFIKRYRKFDEENRKTFWEE